jgi:hypothetical protein
MLLSCRLAGLSTPEGDYAGLNAVPQLAHAARCPVRPQPAEWLAVWCPSLGTFRTAGRPVDVGRKRRVYWFRAMSPSGKAAAGVLNFHGNKGRRGPA